MIVMMIAITAVGERFESAFAHGPMLAEPRPVGGATADRIDLAPA